MRLGMFMMPVHPPGRKFWSTLEEDTEKSVLADQLGFDELWMGEHFSATTEPIPLPDDVLRRAPPADQEHRRSAPPSSTCPIIIPRSSPAEAAQFDHMSKGRFMLGIGPGGLVSDFELFNTPDMHARNRMVIEAVDIIQRIWSQDPPYDLQGEFWNVQYQGWRSCPSSASASCRSRISSRDPRSPSRSRARTRPRRAPPRSKGWGMISANIIPTLFGGEPLGRLQQGLRRSRHARQRRELAGRAQCAWWRRPIPRRMTAYSASRAPTAISSPTCARCSTGSGSCRSSSRART